MSKTGHKRQEIGGGGDLMFSIRGTLYNRPILNSGIQYFEKGDVQVLTLRKPACETSGGGGLTIIIIIIGQF